MSDFTINDRRSFDKDGQLRPDGAPETSNPKEEAKPAPEENPKKPERKVHDLPPASFSSLVIALATSAFISLGEGPGPDGQVNVDLASARHTIDLLGVLEKKTIGNLDPQEEELLKTVLYDLRVKFTNFSKK